MFEGIPIKFQLRCLNKFAGFVVAASVIDSKSSGNKVDMTLNDSSSRSCVWKAEKVFVVLEVKWATLNIKFLRPISFI